MLNTTGVVYKPNKEAMSDNNDEEKAENHERIQSTHSQFLPKDFMDRDDVKCKKKGSLGAFKK